MSDVKEQLTRSWLVKARHDLLSARQLARADVPLFDTASAFTRFLDGARFFTPLAVAFRYPGEYDQPEPEEFAEALAIAEDVYAFVLSLLPATCHPE